MTVITAVGTIFGAETKVVCIDLPVNDPAFLFDGVEDEALENRIRNLMKRRYLIGGTYCPEQDSMINVKNVLEYHFFEKLKSLEVEGDIGEIPSEDGRIY
jgi:hypothetical protein